MTAPEINLKKKLVKTWENVIKIPRKLYKPSRCSVDWFRRQQRRLQCQRFGAV